MSETLFDKYGGIDTFSDIVSNFYQKISDSDNLEPYFRDTDMNSLMEHQTNFIANALGSPEKYHGQDLKTAHASLNIQLPHFKEAGVTPEDIKTIISVIENLQDQIVT